MKSHLIKSLLEKKSNDELRVLSRKFEISGYSTANKNQLIELLLDSNSKKLQEELLPTWWQKYHNHVYGVAGILGIVLSVIFYFQPYENHEGENQPPAMPHRIVEVIEAPFGFSTYGSMTQREKSRVFNRHLRARVQWEGYISEFEGFTPGALGAYPFDEEIGIKITPLEDPISPLTAHFKFGTVPPTDFGYEFMSQINLLTYGQRVRLDGLLEGDFNAPVLTDAYFHTAFPIN